MAILAALSFLLINSIFIFPFSSVGYARGSDVARVARSWSIQLSGDRPLFITTGYYNNTTYIQYTTTLIRRHAPKKHIRKKQLLLLDDDAALEQTTLSPMPEKHDIGEAGNEKLSTMREAYNNNNLFAETKHAPSQAIIEEIKVLDLGKEGAGEIKQFTAASSNKEVEVDEFSTDVEIFGTTENAEITVDDSFPQARDFLVNTDDDAMTIANQATKIVDGFNDGDDIHDDARTIATQRTTATRVQHVSAAFRSAMTNIGEAEQRRVRHPHQTIFDILDKNFKELGDGGIIGGGRWRICHEDVKLCFVAFVSVFSLPLEPILSAHGVVSGDSPTNHEAIANKVFDANVRETSAAQGSQSESILQRVPLSVAFALWNKVLEQSSHSSYSDDRSKSNDHLSYIRSTLVLLGMLDLASIKRDRDDGVVQSLDQSSGNSNKSIECLVVHDQIHQQYGEYLAWGDHDVAYRSLIEADDQQWNEAVMHESKQIGSNQFTLRMLSLNIMRTNHMQETFDLLNDKTFVRRRIRVLGATGAAKAHVGDIDELLSLIEKLVTSGKIAPEPRDEREGLLGAYQQMRKYCLYETEELTKCRRDDNGEIKLGKTAMYKAAEMGNALHHLGASLGGYGFFDEEMGYSNEALQLKTLAVNGKIESLVAVLDTLHSMGFSLDNAGKKDEALECYDQALRIRYKCLGDDDLRVAETQHNMGALSCEEDRAEEAMECLEEALRIREIHYGEEHKSCADTMQWMGNGLRKHGDPLDALDYFKFALSIKQQRLGIDHIDVANTLFNTAVLLDDIEKFDLSLVAYKEALRIRKLVLGDTNQEVADTLFCMGKVAAVVKNHIEALVFYEESIKIREDLIREDNLFVNELDDKLLFLSNPTSPHPDLLLQYKRLKESFEEALPLTKLIMGTNHPKVYESLNRMGEVYMKLHDWDNAIGSFQGALRVKSLNAPEGQDDLEVAALLQKKGIALLYKHEFVRAKATFDSAMQIHKTISGYVNDFSHAKLLFQECMRIQEKLVGEDDVCIVLSLIWLGRQHQKVKEPQKALERYLSAYQIRKKKKASIDYRPVVMLLHVIGKLYEDDNVNLREITSGLQQLSNLPPEPNPPRPNNLHRNTNTAIYAKNQRKVNLQVLQRIYPNVFEVAKTVNQIAVYEYNNAKQTSRTKKSVDGSLSITKRLDTPTFKVTMLNRSSTAILEVPITASFQLQVKSPYLMFRDNPASNDFHVILFHNGKERDEIASYLEQVVKQEKPLKCYNEEINLIRSKLDAEVMQTSRMLVNAHLDPGNLFKGRGNTERSIEHLETALELTKKCDGENSFREGEISDHLGMLCASRSDFASAKLHYSTAYSVYEKTTGRDDLTTSDCAFRLDVNFFSPTAWVAPMLQFSNSDKDWFRESWELENNNILNIVGGGGGKEEKELASNVMKSKNNNVASLHTDGPGRTVVQDEDEEKEENNVVWSASDNNFGAKKEEEIFGKKANNSAIGKNENYGNTEMDDASAEKEAETERMHPTSCSGSCEWDGIPERNEEMDVKSKPKEEKYSNEVRHDHQQGVSFGIVNSDSSTAYEGFGTVVDSSSLSRKESMDESYDDEDSNSIGAASEGTHGLATEFDPLSMFGEEKIAFLTRPDGRDWFLSGGTRATPVLGIASLRCDCSRIPLECRKRKTKAMSADSNHKVH